VVGTRVVVITPLHASTAAVDSRTLLVHFPPADAAISHALPGPMLLVAALFAPITTIECETQPNLQRMPPLGAPRLTMRYACHGDLH
jgi:hypothetical protein